jgi:hypothetical protein
MDYINYFGKKAKVLQKNNTHILIQFENGTKLCTNKNIIYDKYNKK